MLSLEGKQLGNYDVIRPIRVGGMGAVYEGRQRTAFGRRVAIKVIHNDYAGDRDMRRRFAREARTIARLQHPHILPLIEFGDEQGILYLVMPLIEGGTLTGYLRHNLPDLAEATAIYRQLLDAVEYAHEEGLIHRDIKSSNVLLEMRRNGPPHVYLADFGLVRFIHANDSLQVGKPIPLDQVPGTPYYMAPEQTRGIVTPLTDIYALGVLLYQLLTGVLPYNGPDEVRVIQMHLSAPIPSPCDHDASIPYELGEVVQNAMAKRPDERYQNVAELRRDFLAALKGPGRYGAVVEARDGRQSHRGSSSQRRPSARSLRDEEVSLPPPLQRTVPTSPAPEPIVLQSKSVQEPPGRARELAEETQGLVLRQSPENTSETRARPEIAHRLERADRVRTTDSIRGKQSERNRVPDTDEPTLPVGTVGEEFSPLPVPTPKRFKTNKIQRRHRFMLALIAATVLAIILAVASNALGMNILPRVGGPQAIVQITETPTQLQESYVLTAAAQYTTPDAKTFTMPARLLQSTSSSGNTTATTGLKNIDATVAQGMLQFTNTGILTAVVPAGQEFVTSTGVHIKVPNDVNVPGAQDGQNGIVTAPAIAVLPGAAGNIAAFALKMQLNPQVTVQNPNAFSSGADAQVVHIVTQADIDRVLTDLRTKLTQQVGQQLQNQLAPDEVMAGKPSYSETSQASVPPVNTQADQVQVTLKVQESVPVYKPSVAVQVAATLLDNKANHSPGANLRRAGDITRVADPSVSDVKNNTVILSVTVHGTWVYNFSTTQTDQWRQAIKGLTPAAAQSYLKGQKGVSDVHVDLAFGTDHLPSTVGDIKIEFTS